MKNNTRLDQRLLELELVAGETRSQVQGFILAGLVYVNGQVITKTGYLVKQDDQIEVKNPKQSFVSRGGIKLAGALDYFQIDVSQLICLDVGAGTGGFTDCLLQRGAAEVSAVDVGYGQLAYKLRMDNRVNCIERINVRYLKPNQIFGPFNLIVSDLSFISLTIVLPILVTRIADGGYLLCLVKPQFELDRRQVGRGGIVREKANQLVAVQKIRHCLLTLDLKVRDSYVSPITGLAGNVEYFILSKK